MSTETSFIILSTYIDPFIINKQQNFTCNIINIYRSFIINKQQNSTFNNQSKHKSNTTKKKKKTPPPIYDDQYTKRKKLKNQISKGHCKETRNETTLIPLCNGFMAQMASIKELAFQFNSKNLRRSWDKDQKNYLTQRKNCIREIICIKSKKQNKTPNNNSNGIKNFTC
eukprot:TRINITY_DN43287_c0_g1_i5.p1 TRINITY_DN43287_c0_g1~~TRINITY_DN43287_c0_g1_i5.p1  ORF type:complete len:191 (+),score=4.13 TRINITY_DN43287_c0_g1_i5:69-575(+)